MSAILALKGFRVMQIGCDPKADSTLFLRRDIPLVPILDTFQEKLGDITCEDMVVRGYQGVICAEAGGPSPGTGCAGRGIIKALDLLKLHRYEQLLKPDVVFYDVLGDVVCGGFAMPLRNTYSDKVVAISSGEQMSIHAARNLGMAIKNVTRRGYGGLSGIIVNKKNVPHEDEKMQKLALELRCPVVGVISESALVRAASDREMTVLEAFGENESTQEYERLALSLIEQ